MSSLLDLLVSVQADGLGNIELYVPQSVINDIACSNLRKSGHQISIVLIELYFFGINADSTQVGRPRALDSLA